MQKLHLWRCLEIFLLHSLCLSFVKFELISDMHPINRGSVQGLWTDFQPHARFCTHEDTNLLFLMWTEAICWPTETSHNRVCKIIAPLHTIMRGFLGVFLQCCNVLRVVS